jgi:hypothetical protein
MTVPASAPNLQAGPRGRISKRIDRPYAPGNRGIWVKSKCLNREEVVIVGWTDPEGSRSHIGALLLSYHTEDGQLHYAGRPGTGVTEKELKRPVCWRASGQAHAAGRAAAARQTLWLSAQAGEGPLGAAGADFSAPSVRSYSASAS